MAENSDQWKGEGDCRKCRRVNYCKTECRAHTTYRKTIIGQMIRQRTGIGQIAQHIQHLTGEDELEYIGKEY